MESNWGRVESAQFQILQRIRNAVDTPIPPDNASVTSDVLNNVVYWSELHKTLEAALKKAERKLGID